jgi:hypothetical protein
MFRRERILLTDFATHRARTGHFCRQGVAEAIPAALGEQSRADLRARGSLLELRAWTIAGPSKTLVIQVKHPQSNRVPDSATAQDFPRNWMLTMHRYDLAHLSDSVLLRDLTALVAQDRSTTADLLAHIAEVDARRLYAPAGYSSMFAYCVEELRLSEDAAGKRIQAARAARRFPALFPALVDGRLHLAAICLLAPHLTPANVGELIEAATHRRKVDLEALLARRLSRPEPRTMIRAIPPRPIGEHAPGRVDEPLLADLNEHAPGHVEPPTPSPGTVDEHAPGHVDVCAEERYLVQVTVAKSTHDKLRYAQALLSHAVSRRDVAQVLDRALDALIAELEKKRFGAAKRSCAARRRSARRSRYIPARIRRAVWERDQGKCTFVSAKGIPCNARDHLEFDHIEPVARGGLPTVDGLRLRCRAHNQYEADRVFGAGFMNQKREKARNSAPAAIAPEARARCESQERIRDVLAGLRSLGCRAVEARRAAEHSETLRGASLEDRMRAALAFLGSGAIRKTVPL